MPATTPQACTTGFTEALIRRDMEAALGFLADDVVFFYSNGAAIVGKDAFAALMTASWAVVEDYRYSTLDAKWVLQSNAAASIIYRFAWSGVARGEKVEGGGRGTRVFRKDGAGWLIVHEHLSTGQWTP